MFSFHLFLGLLLIEKFQTAVLVVIKSFRRSKKLWKRKTLAACLHLALLNLVLWVLVLISIILSVFLHLCTNFACLPIFYKRKNDVKLLFKTKCNTKPKKVTLKNTGLNVKPCNWQFQLFNIAKKSVLKICNSSFIKIIQRSNIFFFYKSSFTLQLVVYNLI